MVSNMATVLQSNTADEALVEADLNVIGVLREARGEAGARKVVLDLIVEGFGNQADGHYYSKDLLERIAHRFEGAKMYSDHLTREAEQKLGGLPRSWQDMVGRIDRVWTDVNESGKRVIRGEAQIFDDKLWRLLEQAIDAVGVSINARGTASPGTVEGRPARVVDDITKVKSVDVVAEAGAGGRILALVEAAVEEAIQEGAQMSARSQTASIDDELERDLREGDDEPAAGDDKPDTAAAAAQQPAAAQADAPAQPQQAQEPATPAQQAQEPAAQASAASTPAAAASATQAIAREAALAVLQEMGMRPGDPVRAFAAPPDIEGPGDSDGLLDDVDGPGWNDGTGYVPYRRDELYQAGDPIATRRTRYGLREADDEPDDDDDVVDFSVEHDENADVPGLPEGAAATAATIEARIEARARELAGQRLYEAVTEAMVVVRDHYAQQTQEALAEANRGFERKLAQRDQRHLAAQIIEGARLPRTSEKALKEEFFDAYYEQGDTALREAVTTAVEAKQQELGTYTGARVTGAGATESLTESLIDDRRAGSGQRHPKQRRAEIDEGIERELGDHQRSEPQ